MFFRNTPNLNVCAALKTIFFFFLFVGLNLQVIAQNNQSKEIDHLTVAEDELVHNAQELDKRTEIFVKAIDRRLQVLNKSGYPKLNSNQSKSTKKDKKAQDWGELPTGNQSKLLADIHSILNEAVRNIDNVAERNAKNPLLPKSLNLLAEATARFRQQLKLLDETTLSDPDRRLINDIAEISEQIVAAQRQHGQAQR